MINYKDFGYAINVGSKNMEYKFAESRNVPVSARVTSDNFHYEDYEKDKARRSFEEFKSLSPV